MAVGSGRCDDQYQRKDASEFYEQALSSWTEVLGNKVEAQAMIAIETLVKLNGEYISTQN